MTVGRGVRVEQAATTSDQRLQGEVVWVVIDDGTIYDVVAFRTYTDAARFKAVYPDHRSGPWRCPVESYRGVTMSSGTLCQCAYPQARTDDKGLCWKCNCRMVVRDV